MNFFQKNTQITCSDFSNIYIKPFCLALVSIELHVDLWQSIYFFWASLAVAWMVNSVTFTVYGVDKRYNIASAISSAVNVGSALYNAATCSLAMPEDSKIFVFTNPGERLYNKVN